MELQQVWEKYLATDARWQVQLGRYYGIPGWAARYDQEFLAVEHEFVAARQALSRACP